MDSVALKVTVIFHVSLILMTSVDRGLCMNCTKQSFPRLLDQGLQSRNSTLNRLLVPAVTSLDVNAATIIDDEVYECSTGCCEDGCCKESLKYDRLASPAFVFLMLLCGCFSGFLMLKLILSSQTYRSLFVARSINNTRISGSTSSQATPACRSSTTNAEPPAYITCIYPDSISLEMEAQNPPQPCNNPAISGSLPSYNEVFKNGELKGNGVAVINQSGEVIFKSYSEAFAGISGTQGEIREEDNKP